MRTECMDTGTLFPHSPGTTPGAARRFLDDLLAAVARGLESVTKASLLDRARREAIDAARCEGGKPSAYAMRIRRLP